MPQLTPYIMGRFDARLDRALRVSVPADWRTGVNELVFLLPTRKYDLPLITVLPEAAYLERLWRIDHHPAVTQLQKDALKGRLAVICRTANLSRSGRLAIPRDCCEPAGLAPGVAVALVGRGTWFDVWQAESYQRAEVEEERLMEEMSQQLGIF